jgi:hypothetical protein
MKIIGNNNFREAHLYNNIKLAGLTPKNVKRIFPKRNIFDNLCIFNSYKLIYENLINLDCSNCDNLNTIPILPYLEILICGNLENIPILPNLWYLRIESNRLKNIPTLPKLRTLHASNCSSLMSITSQILLENLECNQCDDLNNISICPNLYNLQIVECYNIKYIPYLENLSILKCYKSDISYIPLLSNLHILDCKECNNLIRIGNLPKLSILYIESCNNIIELYELDQLDTLHIIKCSSITNIQYLYELTFLKISESNIDNIKFNPNLVYLDCYKNNAIIKKPSFPKLQYLYCNSCYNLEEISTYPMLQHFNFRNNPKFTYLRDTNNYCIICYEYNDIFNTICNHTFHRKCLDKWLVKNNSCPLCRKVIKN